MKTPGVKISETQDLAIKDLADSLDMSYSSVCRAAIALGFQKLRAVSSKDKCEGQQLALMEDLKAKQ